MRGATAPAPRAGVPVRGWLLPVFKFLLTCNLSGNHGEGLQNQTIIGMEVKTTDAILFDVD